MTITFSLCLLITSLSLSTDSQQIKFQFQFPNPNLTTPPKNLQSPTQNGHLPQHCAIRRPPLLPHRFRSSTVWHAILSKYERHPRRASFILVSTAIRHCTVLFPTTDLPIGVAVSTVEIGSEEKYQGEGGGGEDGGFRTVLLCGEFVHCL